MKRTDILVAVIDGQGGGMGRALVEAVKKSAPDVHVRALGTNALATAAMLKAGADDGATGENAVMVNVSRAQIVLGVVGVLASGGLLGEITPAMAAAVGQSRARRILLPVNQCDNLVVGAADLSMADKVREAAELLRGLLDQ